MSETKRSHHLIREVKMLKHRLQQMEASNTHLKLQLKRADRERRHGGSRWRIDDAPSVFDFFFFFPSATCRVREVVVSIAITIVATAAVTRASPPPQPPLEYNAAAYKTKMPAHLSELAGGIPAQQSPWRLA